LVSMVLVLSGCDLLEEAKDKLKDAVDDVGPGVKGTVEDLNGKPIEKAKVTVFGIATLDDLKAILPPEVTSLDNVKDIDKNLKINTTTLLENAKTIEDTTTDEDGEYLVKMTALAYVIFVEGPEGDGYKAAFKGLPQDKKVRTLITTLIDFVKKGGKYPDTYTKDEKFAIIVGATKIEKNFTLAGGPSPMPVPADVAVTPVTPAAAPEPAPAVVDSSKFKVTPAPDGEPAKVTTPPADGVTGKDYYPFSFAFIAQTSGSAWGEYSIDQGQPIGVATNTTVTYDGTTWVISAGTSAQTGKKAKKLESGAEDTALNTSRLITITGCIADYANSARYLVVEYSFDKGSTWTKHIHYIGFDASGTYETRPIYLPEQWYTRLSMADSLDASGTPVNQSYSVTFADEKSSAQAPFVAIMSYDKGFAVEASKSDMDYSYVIDLDYMVTDMASGEVTAWYNDANDYGMLTYDTWFGYGPEIIVGKADKTYDQGITIYSEPYSIGSQWGDAANITVHMTVVSPKGLKKDFSKVFNENGESFNAGTYKLTGEQVTE